MEEVKLERGGKKGVTYPAKIKGVDYVEYQSIWVMKKKIKKMNIDSIKKNINKYMKYIDMYNTELKCRENDEIIKKQEEEKAEKELLEQLLKKYNK